MTIPSLVRFALLLTFLFVYVTSPFAQQAKPSPTPTPTPVEDKVYLPKEVDVKAKVKRQLDDLPQPGRDCEETVRLFVILKVVLHKSGKVTEVVVIRGTGCSYDKDASRVAHNLKFIPAMKDGHPVSQYLTAQYEYLRH